MEGVGEDVRAVHGAEPTTDVQVAAAVREEFSTSGAVMGVVVAQSDKELFHSGLIFKGPTGTVMCLHMVGDRALSGGWKLGGVWVGVGKGGLNPESGSDEEAKLVAAAGLAAQLRRQAKRRRPNVDSFRYGLQWGSSKFVQGGDGGWVWVPELAGEGLTCSTFAASLLLTCGIALLVPSSWPSVVDGAPILVDRMRRFGVESDLVGRVEAEACGGAKRIPPVDLAAACCAMQRPCTHADAVPFAPSVRKHIASGPQDGKGDSVRLTGATVLAVVPRC